MEDLQSKALSIVLRHKRRGSRIGCFAPVRGELARFREWLEEFAADQWDRRLKLTLLRDGWMLLGNRQMRISKLAAAHRFEALRYSKVQSTPKGFASDPSTTRPP
jgi:hypothetical protein